MSADPPSGDQGGEAEGRVVVLEADEPPGLAAPVDAKAAEEELKAAVKGEPPVTVASAAHAPSTASAAHAAPAAPAHAASTDAPTTLPTTAPIAAPASTAAKAASASPGTSSTAPSAEPIIGPSGRPLPPKRKRAATRDDDKDADDDEDDGGPRPPRRWPLVAGALALVAGGIAALVLAGRANHEKLYFHCGADKITALRGRSFPPWGTQRLGGPGWKAIAIPPATECTERRTRDPIELEGWYLDALVDQAGLALGTEGGDVARAKLQLEQALLLARSPERRDQRKDIDRLLADVTYAGAAARVKAAAEQLRAAARDFDDAAGRRPRHAADAAAWATFARETADRLGAGPSGERPAPTLLGEPGPPGRPAAPPGVALPVEPPADAGVLAPPDVDAATPGIPGGGVLM